MKLFKTLSAMAVVRAQVPDFTDLNALFASLTENLSVPSGGASAPAEEVDSARYVIATTTHTTITTLILLLPSYYNPHTTITTITTTPLTTTAQCMHTAQYTP